ncbi:ATP-binding protein [Nocardia sp. CC213A]|uniref:ATP-binding protein n=1 Tax=Nocardia sp. CC213A TaxID=3044157 RepID=UPI00278C792F|nr:ATP-binding protein [Nocardia sp. CC213A]
MRDAASSGSKRWALSNWDLRWKVTAVLAVPLLVAVVLGASRISAEFRESTRLSTAVEHVSVIPAITGLSATASQVAGGQMVKIGGNSFTTDPELAQLDTAIQFAEKAAPKLSDMPNARAALDDMIVAAKAIRAQGLAPSESVPDTVAQIERVRGSSVNTVESIVATVADKSVDQAKLQLVDSLNSRAVLVGEVAGFAEALRNNPKDGVRDIQIGISTERQLLAVLAHRFPDGDPLISELQNQVNIRLQLVGSPEASVGQLPVTELKDSLVVSVDKYQTIATDSTKAIVSRVDALAATARTDAIRYAVIVVATILGALALAVLMARSMIVPLRRLRLAALRVAEHDLAHEVSALRDGADPEDVPLEPMPVDTDEEIGQLARAVDDIHGQALRLAADQAAMRTQVNDMFETLARRSKSLVDHQLTLIEAMEYDEKDPRLLENLFRLDHLAARMRRNGDNLLILAGTKQRRSKSAPVEIADVLRAAISEVEDYERVKLGATPRGALVEPAASDLAHLFAELLDNALRASPPETDVKFTFAQAHDTGLLIEVADRGIGMPPAEMAEINRRLETTAEVGPDTARHMGLFVVGRLAERHGLTVRLRPTFDTARDPGVTVTVHVPKALIMAPGGAISVPPQSGGQQQPAPQPGGPQPSAPSSMQMRAVTRTATGNVMVTVDPGGSGAIPAAPGSGAGAPAPAAANASGGLPQRSPGSAGAAVGLPQRAPGGAAPAGPGGLPQRQPGTNGAPPRDPSAGGLPQRAASGGLPQRDPGANGAPPREGGKGLPPREPGKGLPQRGDAPGGLPQRGEAPGGLPQRGEAPGGLPQRGDAPGGLPQRGDAPGGLPQRGEAPGGLPQRAPGSNGAPPQRDSALGGLPQRDSGLPKRDSGLPQRDSAMPRRDAASTGLTQRDTVLPQRESALPQRDNTLLPQRDGGLPQRQPGTAPGGMPQRPSPSGLPQRDPGAGLPQRPAPVPGLRGPAAGGATEEAPAGPGKHSFRSNPQKTASFFQTRLQPASEDDSSFGTPIFAEMMSAWLQDPNADRSQVAASFESPGDEGWQAARRAVESQPEKRTAAGLPQRDPGHRLVPGGVNGNAERTTRRDPESIRSSLSRHQQGVRDGRAQQAMNLTGDKGDR